MHDVSLLKQQLRKVAAILPTYTGDKGNFWGHAALSLASATEAAVYDRQHLGIGLSRRACVRIRRPVRHQLGTEATKAVTTDGSWVPKSLTGSFGHHGLYCIGIC